MLNIYSLKTLTRVETDTFINNNGTRYTAYPDVIVYISNIDDVIGLGRNATGIVIGSYFIPIVFIEHIINNLTTKALYNHIFTHNYIYKFLDTTSILKDIGKIPILKYKKRITDIETHATCYTVMVSNDASVASMAIDIADILYTLIMLLEHNNQKDDYEE